MAGLAAPRLWRDVRGCPWLVHAGEARDLWRGLPTLLMFVWRHLLLRRLIMLDTGIGLGLTAILVAVRLSGFCIVWVWSQGKDEKVVVK